MIPAAFNASIHLPRNVITVTSPKTVPVAAGGWKLDPFLPRTRIEEDSISIPGYLQIPRGELAIARGDVDRGINELEEGTRRVGDFGYGVFFLGSESLAKAWRRKGNLARAVQVLERASEKRSSAAFERAGSLWLRSEFQLARLYREVGRTVDARAIEAELLKLLALADADHPMLLELQRLQGS